MKLLFLPLLALSLVSLYGESHPASVPVSRTEDWCIDSHRILTAKAKAGGFEIILLGDSITWEWEANETTGAKIWPSLSPAPFKMATFAVSGDRTEHLLWRLENGNLESPQPPRAAVIMIGTNNIGQRNDSPEAIAEGVDAVIEAVQKRFPECVIYLYGILPFGERAAEPVRKVLADTNVLLKAKADGKRVIFTDLTKKFLLPDGSLDHTYFRDGLHLSAEGYALWAESLQTLLSPPVQP